MMPLWVAALPFGLVYAVAARTAGLSELETVAMSLGVFSAGGQVGVVLLMQQGAVAATLVGAVVILSIHFVLLGLGIAREARPTGRVRLLTAFLLTDATYAIALARRPVRAWVAIGAGASMYVIWNAATLIGVVAGAILPDPRQLGLDMVVPLTFLTLLAPRLRDRATWATAAVSIIVVAALRWNGLATVDLPVAVAVASLVGGSLLPAEPNQ